MKKITVLLCDDHNVARECLRSLLEAAGDIQVVGEAENGHESVQEAKRLLPDVVVLDLAMPLLNGMGAARQITKEVPSTRVLILSGYSDDQHVVHAIEAGAAGYLMKETAANDLLQAVRETASGNAFFSPPVTRRLLKQWPEKFRNGCPLRTKATTLTSRQTEILQLIAEGYATKQIGGLLSLSIKTVEKHRQDLMNKLNIHNIATLTRYAVSSGVVESNCAPQLASDEKYLAKQTGRVGKQTKNERERTIMRKTSVNRSKMAKALALILGLGSLALVCGVTGCAGDRYTQSTGEHIDDRGTSSRVKRALGEDTQYKYGDVTVQTFKGTVQLSGFVNSRDQKNRAGDLAKKVEGVREVENNITVKESAK